MEVALKHGHPWMCLVLRRTAKAPLAMQLSSYINGSVATAVEVSQGSYVAWNSELVKWKQAHVVKYIINACLTGILHSSKFYLSKPLTTPFVKILHHQTFAPYSIKTV